jgi:hypothetical protein
MSAYKDGQRTDGKERLGVFLSKRVLAAIRREAAAQSKSMGVRVTMSQVAADAIAAKYAR